MKLLHFKGGDRSRNSVEYFVREGQVPRVQFGTATILPGGRLPDKLFSLHERHSELSYVISGGCTFHADDDVVVLERGDALYNPRGTKHFVENPRDETCLVFWALVEE